MRKGRQILAAATMASALFFGSGNASAAIVSYFHDTGPTSSNLTDNFFLNGFNPALGTLTGVTITLDTSETGKVVVINIDTVSHSFTNAFAKTPITVTGPNSVTVLATPTAGPFAASVPGTQYFPITILGRYDSPTVTVTASNSAIIPSLDWAPYIGVGAIVDVQIDFDTSNFSGSTSAPSSVFFGGQATSSARTTVTYDYEPTIVTTVPEPGTLAFFGGGLLLLARRRKLMTGKVAE